MAERGAPQGNYNAHKTRRWKQAIDKACKQYNEGGVEKGQALDKMALTLVGEALDPTSEHYEFAVKEVGLRLDGKPQSSVEINSGNSPTDFAGLSVIYAELVQIGAGRQAGDGALLVSDGPVLPVEVLPETGGHGEGVGVSTVPGSPAES